MCHASDFDHLTIPESPFKPADEGQTRYYSKTESGAKFWREAQHRPTQWLIGVADRGNGFVVTRISFKES